jgi:hypothetical protein
MVFAKRRPSIPMLLLSPLYLFTEPHHNGVSGSEPFDNRTDFCANDSLDNSDESLGPDSSLTEEVIFLTDPNTDVACNLQNVVSFPVAFTNSALHEVDY